jgi:two-component system chemotaxis response regulator CheB
VEPPADADDLPMSSHHPGSARTHDDDGPPPALVVIAASAGGFDAVSRILSALPADLPAAVGIVLHRSLAQPNLLAPLLGKQSRLPVVQVGVPGIQLRAGTVYLAPPDRHLVVTAEHRFDLQDGHRIRHLRSSANPLFESAAAVYGPRVVAVVLTGGDSDGTDGVQSVHAMGGTVIAQDPATAQVSGMPSSAIATHAVAAVLPLEEIAPMLVSLVERAVRQEGTPARP